MPCARFGAPLGGALGGEQTAMQVEAVGTVCSGGGNSEGLPISCLRDHLPRRLQMLEKRAAAGVPLHRVDRSVAFGTAKSTY